MHQVDGLKAQIQRAQKEKPKRAALDDRKKKLQDRRNANRDPVKQLDARRQKVFQEQREAEERIVRDRHSVHFENGTKKKRKDLLHYEIGFDVHETLSVGSFFQGAVLLVVGTAVFTYACLWASRRGSKGRLDL